MMGDSSEEEYSDMDNDYDDRYSDDENTVQCDTMKTDITEYASWYGPHSCNTRDLGGLEEIDINIYIPVMDVMVPMTAEAWNMNIDGYFIIHISHLSKSQYVDGPVPSTKVFHAKEQISVDDMETKKHLLIHGSSVPKQLEKILKTFLGETWKKLTNEALVKIHQPARRPSVEDVRSEKVAKMVAAGDDPEIAFSTLNVYNWDLKVAMQARNLEFDPTSQLYGSMPEDEDSAMSEEADKRKKVRKTNCGFFIRMRQYAEHRLQTINEFCVVCDEPHIFHSPIKPAVCTRELCVFSFQQMGVMADVTAEISTAAEVVHLLLVMAKKACHSARWKDIFDPFPSVPKRGKSEMLFSPLKKDIDYEKVETALTDMPDMSDVINHAEGLESYLRGKHENLYPLVQWIINSNRSLIVKLPPHKQLKCMKTPHQFLLVSASPAQEHKFSQLRAEHGSTFSFHGSPIENWHSIMRNGLYNASGTKYQLNGTAHGSGIYSSPNFSTAWGYTASRGARHPGMKTQLLQQRRLQRLHQHQLLPGTGTVPPAPVLGGAPATTTASGPGGPGSVGLANTGPGGPAGVSFTHTVPGGPGTGFHLMGGVRLYQQQLGIQQSGGLPGLMGSQGLPGVPVTLPSFVSQGSGTLPSFSQTSGTVSQSSGAGPNVSQNSGNLANQSQGSGSIQGSYWPNVSHGSGNVRDLLNTAQSNVSSWPQQNQSSGTQVNPAPQSGAAQQGGGNLPQVQRRRSQEGAKGAGSKKQKVDDRFFHSDNLTCIALCEVIKKDIRKSGPIWVSGSHEDVCTRFFFVYDSDVPQMNLSTADASFQEEIKAAMQLTFHNQKPPKVRSK